MSKIFKLPFQNMGYIGDSEKADIIPAKDLGMKTISVGDLRNKTFANYRISKPNEIGDLLI